MTTNFDSVQEQAVKTALENPNYRWRTVEGVANETGLSAETVEAVIRKNQETVFKSSIPSNKGEALYTTRSHFLKKASLGEKLLGAIKNRLA
jgi:hypothetical protein